MKRLLPDMWDEIKNRIPESNQELFDDELIYLIPMCKEEIPRWEENNHYETVEANIINHKGIVKVFKPGYKSLSFSPEYFNWLLYTKYIIIK